MKSRYLSRRAPGSALALATLAVTLSLSAQEPDPLIKPAVERIELPEEIVPPEPPDVAPPPSAPGNPWPADLRRAQAEVARTVREVERQFSGVQLGIFGPDVRRLLVIPNANATEESIATSREDLAVMATILERAANPGKTRRPDLLFELSDWRMGARTEFDALLIEGYGAVFLLGVDYPLVGPPKAEEKPAETKAPRDSTWERTRRELLGHPESGGEVEDEEYPSSNRAYDATRVDELEQRLKEALKHAGNLRGLTPEDWIIIQVHGRSPAQRSVYAVGSGDRGTVVRERRRGGGNSVLTLRVRKSAVDSYAAGNTKFDDFAREVKSSRRLEPSPSVDRAPTKF